MDRERITWLRLAAVALDAGVLAATWFAVIWARASFHEWWPLDVFPGAVPVLRPLPVQHHESLVFLVVPVWLSALALRGSYRLLRRKSAARIGAELATGVGLATLLLLAAFFVLNITGTSRTLILGFAFASIPALALGRVVELAVLRALRRRRFDPHRVLVVGDAEAARPWRESVERHQGWGIEILGPEPLPAPGAPHITERLVAEPIDEVYVTRGATAEQLADLAAVCDELGVPLSMDANFLGMRAGSVELADYDGSAVLTFDTLRPNGLELAVKRVMDIAGALVGLVLAAPLMVAVAIAIKLQDGGSVLFVQERAGRYGRVFPMIKFRTMIPDAEERRAELEHLNEVDGPAFKMARDPRVTRLGRWLRRSSIDELPQLLNVLLGQMSLVGPRPPLPSEVVTYERWQLRRLSMKPGLTCLWQVSGRSDLDFDRWMALDLEYIDNWSLWLDLSLIARTFPAVLRGTGAR